MGEVHQGELRVFDARESLHDPNHIQLARELLKRAGVVPDNLAHLPLLERVDVEPRATVVLGIPVQFVPHVIEDDVGGRDVFVGLRQLLGEQLPNPLVLLRQLALQLRDPPVSRFRRRLRR